MLKPVLLIAEIFYWNTEDSGVYNKVIETIAPYGFYKGIETAVINDANERKSLRTSIQQYQLVLNQWSTKALLEKELSICSLDKEIRRQAIECVKQCVDHAAECGTSNIGLVSGKDVGIDKREEAKNYLTDSLHIVAEYIKQYNMGLIIEPLDREEHKKQLLGPFKEAVVLIEQLRRTNPYCYLCWDSAHAAIMKANFAESFQITKGYVSQLHLSNAILDEKDEMYGDLHMMFGGRGFLTTQTAAQIVRDCLKTGMISNGMERVAVEVRSLPEEDPWENERKCRMFLQEVLSLAEKEDNENYEN